MKNIIIGTAGHIDHGKTTLIKALTGRNTDRWEEEQRRGITIDLGFTYFDLKSGDRVGIIDVPGHEKFINNMVAGVVGMDLVMLVVAADEGIMPQTREHMDILGILGIEKSILVLNKCDLVDEEWLELVEEEVQDELKGTFLENAPVVKVSAATGQGLDELKDTIERLTRDELEEKDIQTIPRLPIDRVFTLSGFGTIITGTLISGKITKEDVLEMYPIGKECKIRSIQVHGQSQDVCYAGQRVAINLSNVKKKEIKRGCVLAPKNSMKNTELLDVKLNVLDSSMRIVTNHERLHFYTGTSEILCRAVLLDKEEIGPGESGLVQLRLEEEIALKRGDKFVVRFYSPLETIGGGVVLEPNPKRKKRFDETSIEELQRKESGSLADVMELNIKEHGETMVTLTELAKIMAHSPEELTEYLDELKTAGTVYEFPMKKDVYLWHRDSEFAVRQKILEKLGDYHKLHPYRYGMKKAEIHNTFLKKVKPIVFDAYVERMAEEGVYGRREEYLYLPEFTVPRDELFLKTEKLLTEAFTGASYDFVRFSEIELGKIPKETAEDVVLMMIDEGRVIRINEEMFTLASLMEQAKEKITGHLKTEPVITIAQVRDMFSTSRKSAKPILEYMDSIKVTKKTGAESERVSYL
ncbi:selenocysteine-specific translation elongation factor [Bariatricus massiliensis]|uniref:Selenocysteine-specific elongation factor n=1 Tax=Bariatricus massiliensis TaxID=1745713 RepID=A0ABS8DG59_9FIRM|nr:selenocysteine-specific translation elongation factor [Bariatricus massiliensis]MCB7304286.1 selenocysteine-specific translation elongation factor [Bariatricus massiliensis]MCB7374937.1 selenocysteine-specific translation elongation factor [Bariatricus massiliensis]MCB7387396.1 selenocysteine-specific translation elongation factor [Bariatricus massiliensis]MCB7411558.1 selenocysteine-specific translation elongation factor [Bariatricus massiliensis]MCQ5253693.1 selenocysteine-specific transl